MSTSDAGGSGGWVGPVGPPAGWAGDYTPGEREFHEIMCQLADRAWRQGHGIEAMVALANLIDWFPPTGHPPPRRST
ncbi:hypothetical protein O7623_10545 [Solwaraspora sp. WMMD791]|uniref:hypothetical protein n=1 Tax=Solwaraspora sp. WMMD791 TaxID=3016086 RepID=UPI00249B070A|nr:hypothetical protein [Solwaraspora sp. WMMD791]WFE29588.1 hypothetical protein O7623_10545 [Solwaraspora sp. WMMD791]